MAGEAEAVYRPPERCNSVSCWAAGTGCWIFLLQVSCSWSVPTHGTLLRHHLTCPSKGQLHESWRRLWPNTGGWWMAQVTAQLNLWFPGNLFLLVPLPWCFGPFLNHGFPIARVSRQFSSFYWGCQSHDQPLGTVPKTCPTEVAFPAARLLPAHLLSLLVCVCRLPHLAKYAFSKFEIPTMGVLRTLCTLTQMKMTLCDLWNLDLDLSAVLVPSDWIIKHSL